MEAKQLELMKDCLRKQLEEFDMLKSIYYNPGEFQSDNPLLVSDIQDFIDGMRSGVHEKLDYRIKIQLTEKIKMELSVLLAQLYPAFETPILTLRTDSLTKKQEAIVKQAIEKYIEEEVDKNDPYIFQIISWLQDHIEEIVKVEEVATETKTSEPVKLERLWIWSHHIYSKIKRQDLVKLGKDYQLHGFMLPGKPGVICFEGSTDNTQELWRIIKGWQWQKLKIVKTEGGGDDEEKFYRFKEFREILFTEGDGQDGDGDVKMNMKEFLRFLDNHRSSYMKKELFGID